MTFDSANAYQQFAESTRSTSRHIQQRFLDTLIATSSSRTVTYPIGTNLFAARLGTQGARVDAPIPENAKRSKYLHLATDRNTALAEIRGGIGTYISLGIFKTNQKLTLIDCTMDIPVFQFDFLFGWFTDPPPSVEQSVWGRINAAFAEPLTPDGDRADYPATQIIAETCKNAGFDGIIYGSNFSPGKNLALFDLNKADFVLGQLNTVTAIHSQFEAATNPYGPNSTPTRPHDLP